MELNWSVIRSVVPDSLWPNAPQPTRLLCPWDFPGNDTGMGCHSLLQGIFPTQGSNLGLLCPWGIPGKNTGVGSNSFSRGSSQPREWNQVSCTAGRFFTNSYKGSPVILIYNLMMWECQRQAKWNFNFVFNISSTKCNENFQEFTNRNKLFFFFNSGNY